MSLAFESAVTLAGKLKLKRKRKRKEISSRELTDYFIERIERYDGVLNAVVVRDFERARAAANREIAYEGRVGARRRHNFRFATPRSARRKLGSPGDPNFRLGCSRPLKRMLWTRMDEHVIAKTAGRQHGVATAGQLHAAGFDNAAIKRRCRAGRLHRLHRGVYLVGHAVAPEGAAEVAAVLACGPGTVISHRSAAHRGGFVPPPGY